MIMVTEAWARCEINITTFLQISVLFLVGLWLVSGLGLGLGLGLG